MKKAARTGHPTSPVGARGKKGGGASIQRSPTNFKKKRKTKIGPHGWGFLVVCMPYPAYGTDQEPKGEGEKRPKGWKWHKRVRTKKRQDPSKRGGKARPPHQTKGGVQKKEKPPRPKSTQGHDPRAAKWCQSSKVPHTPKGQVPSPTST